jgi:alkylhydroperoxidase family enzyme
MARVSYVDLERATGQVAVTQDAYDILFGTTPVNSNRAMAHCPLIWRFVMLIIATVQRAGAGGVLSGRIKGLVDIKTSHTVECEYCYAHNTAIGMANGITHDEVIALGQPDYMDSPLFTPREKAAILWAEHVTKNTAKHRDDVFEEVRRHFSEPEIVEMTMVCGLRNMRTRFNDSLLIDLESADEVRGRGRAAKLDPAKLKAYIQHLVDNWPTEWPQPEEEPAAPLLAKAG